MTVDVDVISSGGLKADRLESSALVHSAAMIADVDDKILRKKEFVACRIEGHKIQKRVSTKKKALDPLRYLPDNGGSYVLFTIASYLKEDNEAANRRHVVQRSYKQFQSLHFRLLKTYPKSNLPRDLPSMRNKKLDKEYIEMKCNELTQYLAQLMQISQVKACHMLHEFLETYTAIEDSSEDEDKLLIPSRMLEGLPGTIVTVRAGQSFSVTLPLDAAGDVASWQFTTKKHNIGFSATFEGEMICAYSREGADVKPVKGLYRCTTPGTCTLTWDNTYTWSKAKVLIYWAEVESKNGPIQSNKQRQFCSVSVAVQDTDVSAESTDVMLTGSGAGSDTMDVDNRRMGFIDYTRSNAMHPRHLMNSSISLLSKPFVHGHVENEHSFAHGKTRHIITRRMSGRALTTPSELQGSNHSRPPVKAGSLIIQRSVTFRGRNWYRKWFVLDLRKCILRYYDSEATARRGLSLAKLNLSNKHASLAITSSLSLDAAPTPYMFLIRTKNRSWSICASSQSEYNEWESAISTAILTAQRSRRGRKSKSAIAKAANSSAVRKGLHFNESEDGSPQSGAFTDTKSSAVATSKSSRCLGKPPSRSEESDDDDDDNDDDDSDNIDDGDFGDHENDESESGSNDELYKGDDDIEVVQPGMYLASAINSRIEAMEGLPELSSLPMEWKLGLAAVLNVALLSVRFVSAGIIVSVLLIMDWYLVLKYLKHTSDNELDAISSTKPMLE
ncbi:unnamed protein product [Peronospora destructor]|uniref:PX domain-containing protein n=1 Tax=Peronospora destructor TaxID=86335 RepID=A0AAV0V5I6_9STRA|nr:unnamed protein product [Peronospora destructor]